MLSASSPVGTLRDTAGAGTITGSTFTSYVQGAITVDGEAGFNSRVLVTGEGHVALARKGATANKAITLNKSGSAKTLPRWHQIHA